MSSIERYVDKLGGRAREKNQHDQSSSTRRDPPGATLSEFEHGFHAGDQYPSRQISDQGKVTKNDVELGIKLMEESGLLTPEKTQGQLVDEYRAIKRPILKNAFGGGVVEIERGNLVMVTSSLPGEGKTYTSINLAMSLSAEVDQTVLLVESDVSKPAICKYCGIPEPKQGLVDYLLNDDLDLADVLLRTSMPKLSILPAGNRHPSSTELLGSRNMRNLMDQLSSRYPDRIVIFDSPPLLLTNEAVTLSSMMGQIILVVEAAKTLQTTVKQAVELLDPHQVIGLVLNKNRRGEGSGYGYYGGYGYGGAPKE